MSAVRLLRTLIHLRPSQVGFRLWYRLRLPWFGSRLRHRLLGGAADAPALRPRLDWPGDPSEGERIRQGRIRLIGVEGDADGWTDEAQTLLWRFTLHYFEWLPHLAALGEPGAVAARRLVAGWLDRFERFHPLAWHPYPLSLRLFAWLGHEDFLCRGADTGFVDRFRRALDRQAGHLACVLERDVGGNHLIKNLKALIAAALCLPRHAGRLEGAVAMLEGELRRQILADGCHYERSPSYHEQVLGDLMDLDRLFAGAGRTVPAPLADAISRMRPAASFFRHGDGGLALFNDGAVEPQVTGPLPAAPKALPEAGYWRLDAGPLLVLVDCGPCCPDDLPAHAHADVLSFEMSDGPYRLIVNSGTYAYQDEAWRNRLRGTPAHSTLTVDDGDSAEVYGVFRLGRRPGRFAVKAGDGRFVGEHDGWRRLGLVHRRGLDLRDDGLTGWDEVERQRPGPPRAISLRFHLHPGVAVRPGGEGRVDLDLPDGSAWRFVGEGGVGLEPGVYCPSFNLMRPAPVIRMDGRLTAERLRLQWRLERR